MEEKLENPDQMIDFQTEYTKELHAMSDYPKIDFELIRKNFIKYSISSTDFLNKADEVLFPCPDPIIIE